LFPSLLPVQTEASVVPVVPFYINFLTAHWWSRADLGLIFLLHSATISLCSTGEEAQARSKEELMKEQWGMVSTSLFREKKIVQTTKNKLF